jgi:hypothetical protein
VKNSSTFRPHKLRDFLFLATFTCGAILVSGYHYGVEDMGIYLPAIKKIIDPNLYPYDANFFLLFTRWTLFHQAVAAIVRVTHISLETLLFVLHVISIFLVLLGCLQLARKCFSETYVQWSGIALVATFLTMPVAGTALFLVDQHLHPRTFATAFLLFATVAVLEKRPIALLWIFLTALCHPTMAVYGSFHLFILALPGKTSAQPAAAYTAIPFGAPPNPIWRDVMAGRSYHYPFSWAWYEWLGALAPIALLEYFVRVARRENMPTLERVCRRLVISTVLGIIIAVAVCQFLQTQTQTWARLEPMRILHFTYVIFILFSGAMLGKYVLREQPLRWLALFVPLASIMFYAQRQEFPSSYHVEWPGRAPRNQWVKAFDWVRYNTPQDALFALDPDYAKQPGEDYFGFRAYAERSMLADSDKDASVVALFPELAWQWRLEVRDRKNWQHFTLSDFEFLRKKYGVTWVIVRNGSSVGMPCPYENPAVTVCQIP